MEIKSRIRKPSNKKVTKEIRTENLNLKYQAQGVCGTTGKESAHTADTPAATYKGVEEWTIKKGKKGGKKKNPRLREEPVLSQARKRKNPCGRIPTKKPSP